MKVVDARKSSNSGAKTKSYMGLWVWMYRGRGRRKTVPSSANVGGLQREKFAKIKFQFTTRLLIGRVKTGQVSLSNVSTSAKGSRECCSLDLNVNEW